MNNDTQNGSSEKKNFLGNKKRIRERPRGFIAGMILGYLVSYLFQSGMVQLSTGLYGYVTHIFDVLFAFKDKMWGVAFTAWLCMIIGGEIGSIVEGVLIKKGVIGPKEAKPGQNE